MYLAAVKHHESDDKVFYFKIPNKLVKHISIGSKVVCSTSKGTSDGLVKYIIQCTDDDALVFSGGNKIKKIFAVEVEPYLYLINTEKFFNSHPRPEKIEKRCAEFIEYGEFKTPVIFDSDLNLKDGYSAYIVAKMVGKDKLKGFCFS